MHFRWISCISPRPWCWVCYPKCLFSLHQFGSCSYVFGRQDHLEHHVLHNHVLPNAEVTKCLWGRSCPEYLYAKDNMQVNTYGRIGSGNGLVLSRQQTISWTNDDPVHWCICVQNISMPRTIFINKMADDFQTKFSNALCSMKNIMLIQISFKFVPKGPNGNDLALVQVMAWCRTDNKPLPEPGMSPFTEECMHHWGPSH